MVKLFLPDAELNKSRRASNEKVIIYLLFAIKEQLLEACI